MFITKTEYELLEKRMTRAESQASMYKKLVEKLVDQEQLFKKAVEWFDHTTIPSNQQTMPEILVEELFIAIGLKISDSTD